MKINRLNSKFSLVLFICVILLTSCRRMKIKSKPIASEDKAEDYKEIWKSLFTEEKPNAKCENNENILEKQQSKIVVTKTVNGKVDYSWVKKWGNGDVSYLFDYLDVLLQKEVVKEFKSIYEAIFKLPKQEDDKKLLDAHLVNNIYTLSVNSFQLQKAQNEIKWNIPEDDIKQFIVKYDLNQDARLSPKELILASIHANGDLLGTDKCKLCYKEVSKVIKAIFNFINCGSGYINAEQIWEGLELLKRPSNNYNIYTRVEADPHVTNSVNEFVLKNSQSKRGELNEKEFVKGILLGYWDRQTADERIIEDDSKTLKSLRWNN